MSHSKILLVALVLSLTIQLHGQSAAPGSVTLIKTLAGHTTSIQHIAFSPRGEILAASGNDGIVRLWNAATGDSLGTVAGQKKADVLQMNWSGDERRLAITYRLKKSWELALCEISSTQPPAVIHRFTVADFLDWSPDNRTFLAYDEKFNLKLWDAVTGQSTHTLTPEIPKDKWLIASFVADGARVLTTFIDGPVKLWDVSTGKLIATHLPNVEYLESNYARPEVPVVSADKRFFISGDTEVYDAASGNLVTSIKDGIPLSFSPDGSKLLTMRYDDFSKTRHRQNYLTLRTIADGKEILTFQVPEGIWKVYWSRGGEKAAVMGLEFNTRIFDTATGRANGRLPYGNCWPWQMCGSDDCERITFSADGAVLLKEKEPIKLWDAENVSLIQELKTARLPASFSPTERLLATRSKDKKSVLLWSF